MFVGVMGTALASPLYPLYQELWGLRTGDITLVYVIYMFSALCSLLFLGKLSDQYGYMPILRGGLVLVTVGLLLSALANSFSMFIVSRVIIGLASSLIVTSASIGLTQLSPSRDLQRAASTTSLMLAFGFGMGPAIGGVIAQFFAAPLRSSYIPSILMGCLATYALFSLRHNTPESARLATTKRIPLPKIELPKGAARPLFLTAGGAAFIAFSIFSLFASLAPSFMQSMVPWHGPAVSGISIGIILFLSASFQLLLRHRSPTQNMQQGMLFIALSGVLLMANLFSGWSWLFIVSVLTTSLGHGLCLTSGTATVSLVARPQQRAALMSTYLIIGYLGAILPMLAIGYIADHFGMTAALISFCSALALLAVALSFLVKPCFVRQQQAEAVNPPTA